jgi:hypothetical protein
MATSELRRWIVKIVQEGNVLQACENRMERSGKIYSNPKQRKKEN